MLTLSNSELSLEPLKAIASLSLLTDNVQDRVDELCTYELEIEKERVLRI